MATNSEYTGYSEAAAHLLTWATDKVLGGAKKAFGWTWNQVEWAKAQDRYDREISRQHGSIRIFGQTTPKPLREIYTDVYVLDKLTALRRIDPDQLTSHLWNDDRGLAFRRNERQSGVGLLETGRQFLVLGKPGAGKTTFLRYLAVREATRGQWGRCLGKTPIFVPLREVAETGKPLVEFIVDQFAICHFPGDATPFVEALLKSGQALVLFDGLDEVSTGADADRRGDMTAALMNFANVYSTCHIVITCRIAAVEATFDPGFTYLEMADFAPEQVEHFVRAWFWDENDTAAGAALAEQMLAEWKKPEHAGIRDLGRSPLLLSLLCLNYAEALHFPVRRVELYQEALDALLKKWDSSRRIQRGGLLYKQLSLGRRQQMFARIAFDAFVRNEIVFPKANLERWLLDYLVNVPEMPAAVDIDTETLLREIVAQHGIFVEQAHHLFSFAHLAFQEYYAAIYIVNNTTGDVMETLLAHVNDARWREVFLLTASLLSDATLLIANIEAALRDLAMQSPQFNRLLRVIGKQADEAPSGCSRSALRLLLCGRALAFALDRAGLGALACALYLAFHLARAPVPDLALVLAVDVESVLVHARILDLDRDRTLRTQLLDRLGSQNRTSVYDAFAAVKTPAVDALVEEWQSTIDDMRVVVEKTGALSRYRHLQAEAEALVVAQKTLLRSLDASDIEVIIRYLGATKLFYDCLQLAYTPSRKDFEARILEPPP